jgi:hypothetical protein
MPRGRPRKAAQSPIEQPAIAAPADNAVETPVQPTENEESVE